MPDGGWTQADHAAKGRRMAIGVFDSGVGGLTVHRELTRRFPDRDFIYLADQANAPYGGRAGEEIREDHHSRLQGDKSSPRFPPKAKS